MLINNLLVDTKVILLLSLTHPFVSIYLYPDTYFNVCYVRIKINMEVEYYAIYQMSQHKYLTNLHFLSRMWTLKRQNELVEIFTDLETF